MQFAVEGFGAGEGCTMEGYEAGMCWGVGPGITPSSGLMSFACAVNWVAFAAGLVLSVLGLPSDVSQDTQAILQIANIVGPDVIAGIAGGATGLGGIVAVTQLLFDMGQLILQDIVQNMVIGFFMWLSVAANFAFLWVPGVLEAKLILLGYSIALGLEGLAAGGCL